MVGNQLKVLVVDDYEDDIFLVKELLREGFPDSIVEFNSTSSGEEAKNYLNENIYDICLFDVRLGEIDRISLLKMVHEKYGQVPVIF